MRKTISLPEYVKKRNGKPLGASGSMTNMLSRSLGANSFENFWRYWNPIWGYYLSRNIMKPLCKLVPVWLATILTFATSGVLHDMAIALVKWQTVFFFTPWFIVMGLAVLVTAKLNITYANYAWHLRAVINTTIIGTTYALTNTTI
ncbi:acyltransferase [Thalassotalea sp. M1531]|uniref:Acyltransferase n=1 Tax=Thalassotalea algicola TaxID=2716224 RepID=A0A7Y0LBX8_9GAMM|nr:MBOAT family O-acyltransferase [Thalassotalea algicola]NMP30871.1 acyltransferase [Thalassotalea algicola]